MSLNNINLSNPEEADSCRILQVGCSLATKMLFFILFMFGKKVCLF